MGSRAAIAQYKNLSFSLELQILKLKTFSMCGWPKLSSQFNHIWSDQKLQSRLPCRQRRATFFRYSESLKSRTVHKNYSEHLLAACAASVTQNMDGRSLRLGAHTKLASCFARSYARPVSSEFRGTTNGQRTRTQISLLTILSIKMTKARTVKEVFIHKKE